MRWPVVTPSALSLLMIAATGVLGSCTQMAVAIDSQYRRGDERNLPNCRPVATEDGERAEIAW